MGCSSDDSADASAASTSEVSVTTTTAPSTTTEATTTTAPATTEETPTVDPERSQAAIDAVIAYVDVVHSTRLDPKLKVPPIFDVATEELATEIAAGVLSDRELRLRTFGERTIGSVASVEEISGGRLRVTVCELDTTEIDASDAPSNVEVVDRYSDDELFGTPVLWTYVVDESSGRPLVSNVLLPGGTFTVCELNPGDS